MPYGYGILSVDALPNIQPADPIGNAITAATGVYNIMGKHYDNKLKSLQNQEKEATLGSSIEATNTKNQADTKYYPLQQDANLRHTNATVSEVMARTGLDRAQATEALAHSNAYNADAYRSRSLVDNPNSKAAGLYSSYMNAPNGSPEKIYYGALLNKAMGGGSPVQGPTGAPMGQGENSPLPPQGVPGGVPGAAPSEGPMAAGYGGLSDPVGEPTGSSLSSNPLGSSKYRTSNQGYLPESGQTIEAPTIPSQTRNQTRVESHSEINSLYPTVIAGLKPYQGPMGSLRLLNDSRRAATDPEAKKRLQNYALSKRFLPELAAINARQSTGQSPGIETLREYQDAMFPGLPGKTANYFIPSDVQASTNENYLPNQSKAVESAIGEERKGYLQKGQPPAWYGQGSTQGYFGPNGYVPATRNSPPVAAGFNGNPNLQSPSPEAPQQRSRPTTAQLNTWAQDAIKRGAPAKEVMAKLKQLQGGG